MSVSRIQRNPCSSTNPGNKDAVVDELQPIFEKEFGEEEENLPEQNQETADWPNDDDTQRAFVKAYLCYTFSTSLDGKNQTQWIKKRLPGLMEIDPRISRIKKLGLNELKKLEGLQLAVPFCLKVN